MVLYPEGVSVTCTVIVAWEESLFGWLVKFSYCIKVLQILRSLCIELSVIVQISSLYYISQLLLIFQILVIFVLGNAYSQIVMSGKPVHGLPKGSADLAANNNDSNLDGEFLPLASKCMMLNLVGNWFSDYFLEKELEMVEWDN